MKWSNGTRPRRQSAASAVLGWMLVALIVLTLLLVFIVYETSALPAINKWIGAE